MLFERKIAASPMGEMLRFGGTLELAGLDLSINRPRVDAITRSAREYLSGLDNVELIEIWRGAQARYAGRTPHHWAPPASWKT